MAIHKYSPVDFFFTCVGLPLFLLDVGLDVLAAVNFYQEAAYFRLGVLLLLLVGSSALVQAYSWLWYSYDQFKMLTKVERCMPRPVLKLLHALQLGIYFRHLGVMETSVRTFCCKFDDSENRALHLSHDLSMLRIIETFSESAPQLVLMLTSILQEGRLDPVTVLKAVASASATAFCVTTYHRSLRSFLPEKKRQGIVSSVVYFFWNLLLISSRLVALALFASVLPCFIFTHFVCSWMLFFFFAWRSKTDFMDSSCGEWLYRATVSLIWYFDWFNVVEGKTRYKNLLYHGFMLVDISVLCSVWCWRMGTDPPHFVVPQPYAVVTAVCVTAVYVLGLLSKILYYKCFHPNITSEELEGQSTEELHAEQRKTSEDEVDSRMLTFVVGFKDTTPAPPAPCNKRMRKLAENFYS